MLKVRVSDPVSTMIGSVRDSSERSSTPEVMVAERSTVWGLIALPDGNNYS